MPFKFNFSLNWGNAATRQPTPPPPPAPAPPPDKSSSCSCSTSSSSSSSSPKQPIIINVNPQNQVVVKKDQDRKTQQSGVKKLTKEKIGQSESSDDNSQKNAKDKKQKTKTAEKKNEGQQLDLDKISLVKKKPGREGSDSNSAENTSMRPTPSKIPENVKTRILAKSAKNPNRGKKDEYRDFRHKQLEDKPAVPRRNELLMKHKDKMQRLILCRNGESMDDVFPSWRLLAHAYGFYRRYNANMPKHIPQRCHGLDGFVNDSPLTNFGQKTAYLLAASIKHANIMPHAVYCSPALRCFETASYIHAYLNVPNKIRVEPGLTKFDGEVGRATWMTVPELNQGFGSVDAKYIPHVSRAQVMETLLEPISDFYNRVCETTMKILKHDGNGGTIIIVAPSRTMDVIARFLNNPEKMRVSQFDDKILGKAYPHTSSMCFGVNASDHYLEKDQLMPFKSQTMDNKADEKFSHA